MLNGMLHSSFLFRAYVFNDTVHFQMLFILMLNGCTFLAALLASSSRDTARIFGSFCQVIIFYKTSFVKSLFLEYYQANFVASGPAIIYRLLNFTGYSMLYISVFECTPPFFFNLFIYLFIYLFIFVVIADVAREFELLNSAVDLLQNVDICFFLSIYYLFIYVLYYYCYYYLILLFYRSDFSSVFGTPCYWSSKCNLKHLAGCARLPKSPYPKGLTSGEKC